MEPQSTISDRAGVPGLRAALSRDHVELERTFARLLAACRADAREEVAQAWTALHRRLTAHLAFEEQFVFPHLAKVDGHEAETLALDHQRIRRCLDEMNVEVDLHLLRLCGADAFIALLHAHAQREDAFMYRWAEASLPEPARSEALAVLRDLGT